MYTIRVALLLSCLTMRVVCPKTIDDIVGETTKICTKTTYFERLAWLLQYHAIGTAIIKNNFPRGMQENFIEKLAAALAKDAPQNKNFSRKNLHYMAHLATHYSHEELAHSALGLISWGHVILLLCIVPDKARRETLARAADENAWTLAELWDKINDEFNHSPRPPRPRKRPAKLQ